MKEEEDAEEDEEEEEEKEEEAVGGVGEISVGLRTDTSGCSSHSGPQSCERRVDNSQAQSRRVLRILPPQHGE